MRRSRQRLDQGTICYLCCRTIAQGDPWDRDHVPPERFFGTTIKQKHNPQLDWLPTHRRCNAEYRRDEEYFCTCFAVVASGSYTADAVLADIRRGFAKGHHKGLGDRVRGQFSKIETAAGDKIFTYDGPRVLRVVWKLVRGLFFQIHDRPLPETAKHHCFPLIGPHRVEDQLAELPWIGAVTNTEPMGTYGKVLDYKAIGWRDDIDIPGLRAHVWALLFWDRVIAPVFFHDPTCGCEQCLISESLHEEKPGS